MKNLQTLSFRFNSLTKTPTNLPFGLRYLDLVGNPITALPKSIFSNLTQVTALYPNVLKSSHTSSSSITNMPLD